MRSILISFLIILMAQPPQILCAAQSPQIDPDSTYRLTNDGAPGKSLAYSKRGDQYVLTMDDTRDSAEQFWKLTPAGGGARLTNIAVGGGKSLDTPKNGNQFVIVMADTGNYSGQSWIFMPLGNGKYRLTSLYALSAIPMKSLDTAMSSSQHVVVMADAGNSPGQMWTLTKVTPPVAVAPGSILVPPQIATPQITLPQQIAPPPQIDPDATYRLTSDYLVAVFNAAAANSTSRPGMSLSVSKSGDNYVVVMADTKDLPHQVWKFIPLGGAKYRLINLAVGDGKSLDTQTSGERYVLSMQNTGASPGQIWTLTAAGNGKYRLSNDALGSGRSLHISALDTYISQFLLQMAGTSNATRQVWTFTKVVPQLYNATSTNPVPGSQPAPTKDIIVTGIPPGFTEGQLLPGVLLCPKIGPGPKLEKGCQPLFGTDPALEGRTSGPATFRGTATNNKCEAYGRVAGLGTPFTDPRNGGECWSCPVLTHRTIFSVTSTDPLFPACTAGKDDGIVWQSAQYPEPGVAAFINSSIVQLAFNDVAYVDAFLNKRAKGNAAAKQTLWVRMITAPNESPEFKALIFATILLVAEKDPNFSTRPSEAVSIFEDYIRKRRTYVAKDALAMYNAYLGFNAYKQNQGTKSAILAGGPLIGRPGQNFNGPAIMTPGSSLSATLGVPPDDYVNAAYSAAVPDYRGEEFVQALADLSATPYQNPSMGTASFDPRAAIQLGLNVIGSATAIHGLLAAHQLIQGVAPLTGTSGIGIGVGLGLAGRVLDAVAAVMTIYAQQEAARQYSQLVTLADQPVSIARILKSGSKEEKNSLIFWWALATSPYKATSTTRGTLNRDSDVCATYPSQCADIKRIVAAVRPTS